MSWRFLVISFLCSWSVCYAAELSPIGKVIQLLEGMRDKAHEEKLAEEKQFATFKQWCENSVAKVSSEITTNEENIAGLTADIEQAVAHIQKLSIRIRKQQKHVADLEGNKEAATKVREIESDLFESKNKDLEETLDALKRARAVVQETNKRVAQAEPEGPSAEGSTTDLVQVLSQAGVRPEKRAELLSFFQQEPLTAHQGDAHGYEFQSQGILDLFDKLTNQFAQEHQNLVAKENDDVHQFKMLMKEIQNGVTNTNQRLQEDSSQKAGTEEQKGSDETSKATEEADLQSNQSYLSETSTLCSSKASAFAQRNQLRADEIVAIGQALDILKSDTVKTGETNLGGPIPNAFVQLRAKRSRHVEIDAGQERAASFLRRASERMNSRILSTLAIAAARDPLGKVKKLIKDLIEKLMEQANNEIQHQGFCEKELETNAITRNEKTENLDNLSANIDLLETSIDQLTEDISNLQQELTDLQKSMNEESAERAAESNQNKKLTAENKEAIAAVERALGVLQEFYSNAANATALVQGDRLDQPEIFDEKFTGNQDTHKGVVGMLEVIVEDLAKEIQETELAESESKASFDSFMLTSRRSKAEKETTLQHKQQKKTTQASELEASRADLVGNQKELDAANAYYEKLKPSCVDSSESYEDRKIRRAEEIESLKEALEILVGEDSG